MRNIDGVLGVVPNYEKHTIAVHVELLTALVLAKIDEHRSIGILVEVTDQSGHHITLPLTMEPASPERELLQRIVKATDSLNAVQKCIPWVQQAFSAEFYKAIQAARELLAPAPAPTLCKHCGEEIVVAQDIPFRCNIANHPAMWHHVRTAQRACSTVAEPKES
jgi:hypothetical protein